MKDVEDRLSVSLGRQGASVSPASVPFDDVIGRARHLTRRRRTVGGLAAAAVLLAGGVGVWSLSRGDDLEVTIADDPTTVTTTSTDGSLPAAHGSWSVLPPSPLSARTDPTVVWTRTEFIVWGGSDASGIVLSDGAAYDPVAGTWRSITPNSWGHPGASAVWDGTEMIVAAKAGGAAYDPVNDSWRELPTLDLGLTDGVGIDQIVSAGNDVLAVGFGSQDAPVVRVWHLRDARWEESGAADAIGNGQWRAIGRPDGVVLWNMSDGSTMQYRFGGRWSVHQQPDLPEGASLAGDVELVWVGGLVRAVVPLQFAADDRNATMISTLDDDGTWSEPGPTVAPMFALTRTVTFGNDGVVVGGRFDGDVDPMLLDGATGTVRMLTGYPIIDLIDQGVAASDDRLFVWGGQTNSAGEQSTASSPVSATGAIWTRAAAPDPTTSVPPTSGFGTGSGSVQTTGPGQVLDLTVLDPRKARSPDRSNPLPDLSAIQSAQLASDGRIVIGTPDGEIHVMRSDGNLIDRVELPVDEGWSLLDAALGPLDVAYASEANEGQGTVRYSAIATTGPRRGERLATSPSEVCDGPTCGGVRLGVAGVLSGVDDELVLPFVSPTGTDGSPLVPEGMALSIDVNRPTRSDVAEVIVTRTTPDGSGTSYVMRVPTLPIEGDGGRWHLQSDGSVAGIVTTESSGRILVVLRRDGTGVARPLSASASDVYVAVHDDTSRDAPVTTLVTFHNGMVHLDSYDL